MLCAIPSREISPGTKLGTTVIVADGENVHRPELPFPINWHGVEEALTKIFAAGVISKTFVGAYYHDDPRYNSFLFTVMAAGWEVVKRPRLALRSSPGTNGNLDDLIIAHMLWECAKYGEGVDSLVLMSGDGDFVPYVTFLREKGIKVYVMAWPESVSADLIHAATGFLPINHPSVADMLRWTAGTAVEGGPTHNDSTSSIR